MRAGLTISAIGHSVLLAWGLLTFGTRDFDATAIESMPIDIVTASEFNRLTAGEKTAPKREVAKPLAEKIAERKTVEDDKAKVAEKKPEIVAAAEKTALEPEPKKVEPKPEPKPPETRAAPEPEPSKQAEKKADPIAEELRKSESKPVEKKPEKPKPKFDAKKVAALLDKRAPRRQESAGETLSSTSSLGAPSGTAPQLSANEIALLAARLKGCWDIPAGIRDAENLRVPITIRFRPDGSLASAPEPEVRAQDAQMQAMIDSVVRAIIRCQPYTMLSRAKYDSWKELPFLFNPKEMFGG